MCDVRFGAKAVSLEQEESGVRLAFREAEAEHIVEAGFVIDCDGAGSLVRKALELPFEGATYSLRPVLADVRINDARDTLPWPRMWNGTQGLTTSVRLSEGLWRIISIYRNESADGETVPDHEVADMVMRVLGRSYAEVVWASRFQIHVRSASRFTVLQRTEPANTARIAYRMLGRSVPNHGCRRMQQYRYVSTLSH